MWNLKEQGIINDINNEIEQCENLDELFNIWKKAHSKDKLYKYDTPERNGNFIRIDSFIEDGFCVTDEKSEGSVLYISKESNSFNEDNIEINKVSKYTHLYYCRKNNKRTLFARRIFDMQEVASKILDISNDNITFMNINKRGGFKSTNMSTLNVYALEFKDYIIKEIEIINPKIIVCCGGGIKRIIEMIYTKNNKICNIPLIEVKHPSYWSIGDKEYKDLFKKDLLRKLKK